MLAPSSLDSNIKPTIKFLCSYGGKIVPRYPDGKLRYRGGDTRVLSVHRSISFSELIQKLGELCGTSVSTLRCQLPTEDLDALVSITSDEDLANLIEEYDKAAAPSSSLKIRAFLPALPKKTSPPPSSSSSSSKSSSPYTTINSSTPIPRVRMPSPAELRCLRQISKPPIYPRPAGKAHHCCYGNPYLIHHGSH